MIRHAFHNIFYIFFVPVFLSGCAKIPYDQPSIESETTNPTIHLEPCMIDYHHAQCGKLTVFEDRISKSGRLIDLNVAVIPARPAERTSSAIFLLSGGPGMAATQDFGNISFVTELGDYDVVLVDQRGTGKSNKVVPPDTPDWSDLNAEQAEQAYAAWIQQILPTLTADPHFYTTSLAMDDLDDVRQALGYGKIDLVGTSYGTTAAQYYLRQHEDRVRSIILLSGSVGSISIWENQARNAQNALDILFARCDNENRCHEAYPNLSTEFTSLMDRLTAKPVSIDMGNGTLILTSELFAAKVEDMLRDAGRSTGLPRLIHKAYAEDDWTTWGNAPYGDWNNSIMSYSIQCNEAWASFSPEETTRLGHDSFLLGWNLSRAYRYTLLCKYLPPGWNPEGKTEQPSSQVPVLLFNGELDPIDPPANAALAKQIWPNSLSLILPEQGHNLSDQTTARCAVQISRNFIEAASIVNLNTTCLKNIHAPTFITSP